MISLDDRRRGYRRALRIGFAISLVAHLVILLVIGRSLYLEPATAPVRLPELIDFGPPAIVVGRILSEEEAAELGLDQPLDAQPPEDADEADPETPDDEAVIAPALPAPGRDADVDADDGFMTNAERLQPKEGDERLWQDYDEDELPVYLADNPYARYEGEIRARLGVVLDSLNLSEAERRKAMEWLSGEDGTEWGVSEAGIHIGGVVIPINLGALLQAEGPRGREQRRELQDLQDIRYQDMLQDVQDVQNERARQMRERTKEELEQRLKDSLEAALADSTADRT